jgi:hypothetical protein
VNFLNNKPPREVGKLRTDYAPPPELTQLLQSVDSMTERLKEDDAPVIKINHLAEIAYHLRLLTWSEMVSLANATSCDPAVLHKWATSYTGDDYND